MMAKEYIDSLLSRGRYSFTLCELRENLNQSVGSIKRSLSSLKKADQIASPVRGFYIIIPGEYRSIGSLPAEKFIPQLMRFLNTPYYVGLLTASMYHGAAHQQPQVFQIMVPKGRHNIEIGLVSVWFYVKKHLQESPVKKLKTSSGVLLISSPEVTAIDLVANPKASAGFSNIITILGELIEKMNLAEFRKHLNRVGKLAVLQRLGYLFELLGENAFAEAVEEYLKDHQTTKVVLEPRNPSRNGEMSKRWKLLINEQIEGDV